MKFFTLVLFFIGVFFTDRVHCGGDSVHSIPSIPGMFICPGDGIYKDPADCSKFYICLAGNPSSFDCPNGLQFNDAIEVCDWPENVIC